MEQKILNACSLSELLALEKEINNTAYTHADSEYLLALVADQMENFK